ncbi:benzoate para-hydroxylase [Roridomyces roridus]|uniref:Benzoate para-hydroxylase n=1 Tax=Roridomyces roridus TaxID=1738132 RepID=A0AAD7B7A7_9AGAR|nr:benzoate para-hydroxylase [Roridomyces roridus]
MLPALNLDYPMLSELHPFQFHIVAACLLLVAMYVYYRDRLRTVPGPVLARWTPLWLGYHARMGRRYLVVDSAHKKYGPIVRITPNHVSVAHPSAVGIVYGHIQGGAEATTSFDKSAFYDAFVSAGTPSVFSTRSRKDHAFKRRIVSQAFSYRALEQFSPFIQANVGVFVGRLDAMCGDEVPVNLVTWLNYLTFDVLSDLAFGEPLGMLASGTSIVSVEQPDGTLREEDAIALVDGREHLSAVLGINPWFPLLAKVLSYSDSFFRYGIESSSGLADFARRNVSKRLNSGAYRADILGKLIEARTRDGVEVDESMLRELVAETVTLLSAGSDTTASSVAALVYLVKTHPEVHRKLVMELESSISVQEIPTHPQVKDLPYLQAVINEGLRHYATMASGLPRLVPQGGVELLGTYIPAGTEISVPAYTLQHEESIWGGDPEVFRPERWLEAPEKGQYLSKYLLTFGKGPRACLGKNLAYMETQLMLATVILRYNIQIESDVLESTEGFVHKTTGLMVKLSRRKC